MNELNPSSAGGRALLVVEPEFASEHIGVRRVVANYWERLLRLGFEVDLAIVVAGSLRRVSPAVAARTLEFITARSRGISMPAWSSNPRHARRPLRFRNSNAVPESPIDLRDAIVARCQARDYDVSVISNPWLCDQHMADEYFTHGIVYDLVPNLLVAQLLNFGAPTHDFANFSHAHHRGYQFYLDRIETILCISQSTKTDFLRFYEPEQSRVVLVDVPFDMSKFVGTKGLGPSIFGTVQGPSRPRVLLVNVLDPRKNIDHVTRALGKVAEGIPLEIDVVGRERLVQGRAESYLKALSESGANVTWHRTASDELLISLYRSADVLLFPSIYEGLGLPVLEAQSLGTPAVSSSGSSLGEINFNPSLLVAPDDWMDIKDKVASVLDGAIPTVRGEELADRVKTFLERNQRFEASVSQLVRR